MDKLLLLICLVLVPFNLQAEKWSEFNVHYNENGLSVSSRQRALSDGWIVEWFCENNGGDWVEPVLSLRSYLCYGGNVQNGEAKSCGPLSPGESRRSIRDMNICNGAMISEIKVTVTTKPVSAVLRQMHD